jgi:hypothetical protein
MASVLRDSRTKIPEDPAAMAAAIQGGIHGTFELDLVAASKHRAASRADDPFKINGFLNLPQEPNLALRKRYS